MVGRKRGGEKFHLLWEGDHAIEAFLVYLVEPLGDEDDVGRCRLLAGLRPRLPKELAVKKIEVRISINRDSNTDILLFFLYRRSQSLLVCPSKQTMVERRRGSLREVKSFQAFLPFPPCFKAILIGIPSFLRILNRSNFFF